MKQLALTAALVSSIFIAAPAKADIAAGLKARDAQQWEVALKEFEADLQSEKARFEANWRIGETLVMIGKSKEALEFLEAAVEENSEHAEAQYWWGAANGEVAGQASIFSAAGYAKACLKAFEKAVALDPNHLDAREGLMQYYLEAPGFMGGDQNKALEQANAILAQNQERGYLNLAAVYQAQEKPDLALEAYNDLLIAFPTSTNGLLTRGSLHRDSKRYNEAFTDFQALAAIDPSTEENKEHASHRIRLGLYYMGAVSSDAKIHVADGIESLQTFLEQGKFDYPIRESYGHYYLATLHLLGGDITSARTAAERAAKGQQDKNLKKRLKKLRKKLKKA